MKRYSKQLLFALIALTVVPTGLSAMQRDNNQGVSGTKLLFALGLAGASAYGAHYAYNDPKISADIKEKWDSAYDWA